MTSKTIFCFGPDEVVTCNWCGARADFGNTITVDRDEDGPIYKATCPTHGEFLWQVFEDTDEEDDD